jgi:EAL domain-containing protein (putative c-di-GMP-specific phosphodiesterase class I)
MSQLQPGVGPLQLYDESARLSLLTASGILDTEPESTFDSITHLAAEYFRADVAVLGFIDETRVWIKSHCGEIVRELPRQDSVFEAVLRTDGPVVIPDVSATDDLERLRPMLCGADVAFFAGVPVRSASGFTLGVLAIFAHEPRTQMEAGQIGMLENLAEMASNQLELQTLRRTIARQQVRRARTPGTASVQPSWPSRADLRHALECHEFVLFYQPEIELCTRKIIGLEALIRWRHPQRGLIPPMEFIPQAEQSGMILPMGDWGLAEACHQIGAWTSEDPRNNSLRVGVNLSARQFLRVGLADHIESVLAKSGTSSRQLGLELTESSLIPNMSIAVEVLGNLHSLGISLLMDDFGTGYSSLSYLQSFPFDVLKVDRSFVSRMAEGDQTLEIVRTIVELARVLGMDVVAEGIETREQYRLLRQMGCRFGQGFLFAKPMAVEDVSRLLRLPGRVLPDPGDVWASPAVPCMA